MKRVLSRNRTLRTLIFAALLVSAGNCTARQAKPVPNPDLSGQISLGRLIANQNCSSCHAIGKSGDSPNPLSPPLRTLSSKYPIETLEEALAEGIAVGHADMPRFEFPPNEIDALLAYLSSIQQAQAAQ